MNSYQLSIVYCIVVVEDDEDDENDDQKLSYQPKSFEFNPRNWSI